MVQSNFAVHPLCVCNNTLLDLSTHTASVILNSLCNNYTLFFFKGIEEERVYQEAIENDRSVSFLYLKMLAIGPGQVGKSTFLKRLKGLMKWDTDTAPPETHPQASTGQIEMEQMHLQYSRETMAVSYTRDWYAVDSKKEVETQIVALTSLLMGQTENLSNPQPVCEGNDPHASSEDPVIEDTASTDSNDDIITSPTSKNMQSPEANITCEDLPYVKQDVGKLEAAICSPEISNVLQEYERLRIQCKVSLETAELIGTDAIINIADVGGQPAFLDMLPSLTIGPAIYLVFMKLLEGLKTPYPVKYRSKGDHQATICEEYTYTTEEVIFTALSSIACFGHSDKEVERFVRDDEKTKTNSLALLMGTFADEIKNFVQLEENEKQLKQQLKETNFFKENLVEFSNDPCDGNIFFRVNNKSGGQQEILRYRNLLKQLMLNKFKKYAIPVKWLELSICLRLLAQRKDVDILKINDCFEIGEQLNMSDEMVKAALQFLHKYIGLIMYFPGNDKLKDIVICDPQVLFSSLSKLIFEVYDSKDHLIAQSKRELFIETGLFSPNDLPSISEGRKMLSIEVLVELLVHLNIAAPCKSMYFLPAVLRSVKTEALINTNQQNESVPEPLCISFQTGYLPLGFVCALIATLTSDETFELLGREQGYEIYKNKVTFRLQGIFDITLISWPKYCEFRVSRAPGARVDEQYHGKNCCPLIRDSICHAIDRVVQSMSHNSVFHLSQAYKLGFKCLNHKQSLCGHEPLALFDLNNIQNIKCIKCKTSPAVRKTMKAWLAPKIVSEPISHEKLKIGEKLALMISVTGAKPLHYQWFKDENKVCDGVCFQGSKSCSLQINVVSTEQGGNYCCEVSNGFGESVYSCETSLVIDITGKVIYTCAGIRL